MLASLIGWIVELGSNVALVVGLVGSMGGLVGAFLLIWYLSTRG